MITTVLVYVVWDESGYVRYANKLPGGTWSEHSTSFPAYYIQIGIDSANILHAVWTNERWWVNNNAVNYGNTADKSLSLVKQLSNSEYRKRRPVIAIGSDDSIQVSWIESDEWECSGSCWSAVYYAISHNGLSWTTEMVHSNNFDPSEYCYSPEIAVDPNNNPSILWRGSCFGCGMPGGLDSYVIKNNGIWTKFDEVPGIKGRLAIDSQGTMHFIMTESHFGPTYDDIYKYSQKPLGGDLSLPITIPGLCQNMGQFGGQMSVDVDGSDNLHIVAECSDGVYYLTRSIDGSWSAPVLISNVPGEPRIFVDDANIPHVVWLYDNPSNDTYTIFYATQPWREGVNVTVQDNNANPVTDVKAEVYRVQDGPDEKLGTTDSAGKITFTANAWDKIYAVYVGDPEPTNKAYHDGWYRKRYQASEVYTIQNTDDITLNLTRNTYAFNLVVSIEWDAEDFYVRQVAVGFANASSVVSRHE